ncbi:MAG TPA: BON domain-containing protein [Candidatus Sulfotelmatobacter sp.]
MKRTHLGVSFLVVALALSVGCTKKTDDAKTTAEIQSKFSQDATLGSKQLSVEADNGVVTLSGTVDNDAQRQTAGQQAATVNGVKTVINNLQVGATPAPVDAMAATAPMQTPSQQPAPADAMTSTAPAPTPAPVEKPAPVESKKSSKRSRSHSAGSQDSGSGANDQMASNTPPPATTAPAPVDNTPPPPPPPPPPKKFIIDQGTQVTVRLVDPIDSEKNQTGDTFHATLNAPLTSDGEEAVPAGVEITGHLVDVKSASRFAGQSQVVLQLDSLKSGARSYSIQTDQYTKKGSSRGKNTAEKVGGGAVLGSIIGALAGGGKGAAIGAATGAGVGGGVQAATKAQQIKLPSETVLNFTLQAPITVVQAQSADANRQKLGDSQ